MPEILKSASVADKHDGDVTCVVYFKDHLYSAGADGKIKIWDKDLALKRTVRAHEVWIYSIVIDSKGRLYSCSCDGTLKCFEKPLESDEFIQLLLSHDELESLFLDEKDVLYSGDDKGVITKFVDHKIVNTIEVVEEVRGLAIEGNLIYSIRNQDLTISEQLEPSKMGKYHYVTRMSIPGHCPLAMLGEKDHGRSQYIAMATRDGKGFNLISNSKFFEILYTKTDAHEMIINTIVGSDTLLYTGGYDNTVKCWFELDFVPKVFNEINIGSCVNCLCLGAENKFVYSGSSDGIVRLLSFQVHSSN